MTSKEEYLKRYLSGSDYQDPKKKKKKKTKTNKAAIRSMKIIDDDIDFNSLLPENLENTLDEDVGDNDPTVAEVVDERPEHVIELEKYRDDTRWKAMAKDEDNSTENNLDKEYNTDFDQSHRRRERHDSESDQSLPRGKRHDSDSDQSPPRKNRHDSDSDQSPLRQKRHDSDSDQSPPRKKRHDSDSDQSPPRKKRHDSDSDQSPPRRKRHDSESDQSPPRRKRHDSESDQSPPRRKRHDSDSDQSPPRRKRHNSDSDQSPPRRKRHDSESDQSPPRRKRHDSDSDQSPPRKHRKETKDSKSKEKENTKRDNKKERKRRWDSPEQNEKDDKGRAKKTLSGAMAGLQSAKSMRKEAAKLKEKEAAAFNKIDEDTLGKNAKTVFRHKGGKRRNLEEEQEQDAEEEAKKAALKKKYDAWSKGLSQIDQQKQTLQEHMYEMSKPMARSKDDKDLDAMLKDQDREGDPMLAYLTKKKKSKTNVKVKELPKYKGPQPAPNRFNIMPGYRWDGVDRSNGFEKELFKRAADKRATASQAYKWSVEDM